MQPASFNFPHLHALLGDALLELPSRHLRILEDHLAAQARQASASLRTRNSHMARHLQGLAAVLEALHVAYLEEDGPQSPPSNAAYLEGLLLAGRQLLDAARCPYPRGA